MTCSAYTGGRRRKGVKKTARRGRKQRGGMYGVTGETIGTAGIVYGGKSDNAFLDPSGNVRASGGDAPKVGGRRKSRKASRKGRKSRRKMRGGANSMSAGQIYQTWTGAGERGMISPVAASQPGHPI